MAAEQVRRWRLIGVKHMWGRDASNQLLYRTETVAQGPPLGVGDTEPVLSVSDVERVIGELRASEPTPPVLDYDRGHFDGYRAALADVADALDLRERVEK